MDLVSLTAGFLFGGKMRTTKNWGFTNSGAELHMLAHAERTRKRLAKKKPTGQRLPAKFILKKI